MISVPYHNQDAAAIVTRSVSKGEAAPELHNEPEA